MATPTRTIRYNLNNLARAGWRVAADAAKHRLARGCFENWASMMKAELEAAAVDE